MLGERTHLMQQVGSLSLSLSTLLSCDSVLLSPLHPPAFVFGTLTHKQNGNRRCEVQNKWTPTCARAREKSAPVKAEELWDSALWISNVSGRGGKKQTLTTSFLQYSTVVMVT